MLFDSDSRTACPALAGLLLFLSAHAAAASIRHEEIAVEAPFPMPAIRVPVFPDRDFLVTDFGARPGEDATDAVRRAVAACHEAGGGRVVVPAGTWDTGPVHLRSGVNLHLAEGATLLFSADPRDYLPAVQTSWEGMECFNYSPLVYAFESENVALTGKGRLEARMDVWRTWFARPEPHMHALKMLYAMASTDVPVAQRQMAVGENNLRPQFVQFNRCRNVLIEDVTIRHSPFWTVHLLLCESVVVRRIDISAYGHNNDGINPEMSRNVLVEDCRLDQGDDPFAIKAGRNRDAWRLGVPTENIVIRRCTINRGHQLAALGSELSAGIRNVYIHDCTFENADYRLQNVIFVKTNHRRGGFVENVFVENIRAHEVRYSVLAIETDVLYQWRSLVPTFEERLTTIRGITLRDVAVKQTGAQPFRLLGDARAPIADVTLERIEVGTAHIARNRYEFAHDIREIDVRIGEILPEDPQAQRPR
ncbi:glycoside hydrolase family 28 protein [Opitutales bacterium ASA1]|uniref:glycoside hydrolase family 28 protein n=1 Tax=Congregicoccus parvus TaxID=3081749 RepID=UPI002B2E6C09|nr:glycoside hydrolase family 28 protein [Opitutales bacterium ASA1]